MRFSSEKMKTKDSVIFKGLRIRILKDVNLNLIYLYKTLLYPTTVECTLFSSTHGTVMDTEYNMH